MNRAQRKQYWREYERTRQRVAKKYAPAIYRVISEWIKRFNDVAEREGVQKAQMEMGIIFQSSELKKAIEPIYTKAGATYARKQYFRIVKEKADILTWIEIMRTYFEFIATRRIVNVTDNVRLWVSKVVSEGLLEQLPYKDIAERLMDKGFQRRRARVIARTETLGSLNAASRKAADRTGRPLQKVWIAAKDNRTRRRPKDEADHWVMDGQRVDKELPFSNGLQQPGDQTVNKPEEIINCRCTVAFIPKK